MPKILVRQREIFLKNAREMLDTEGYAALSIRRLAKESGAATGTLYNYFRNKDELVAAVMLKDWLAVLDEMKGQILQAADFADGLVGICRCISSFVQKYLPLWMQYASAGGSGSVVSDHHAQLRSQIAEGIVSLIDRTADAELKGCAPLLAETVLAAAMHPEMSEAMLHLAAERLAGKKDFQKEGGDSYAL